MKTRLLFLLFTLIVIQTSKAQYVTIPDSNFRNYLVQKYPTCFNAGKQLDTNCFLITSETSLDIDTKLIESFEGLQYFKTLVILQCYHNKATTLPIGSPYIEVLYANDNKLTVLPELPQTLVDFNCSNNELTSIPALPPMLKEFFCSNNHLTELPALPPHLYQLAFYSNKIRTIPPMPDTLAYLFCDDNLLTQLPAQLPSSLYIFSCANNLLVSLPPLPNSLWQFVCNNNKLTTLPNIPQNMNAITCDHNLLSSLPTLPAGLKNLVCSDNPLYCLPLLPFGIEYAGIGHTNLTCVPNTVNSAAVFDTVLPLCSGGAGICTYNPIIKGTVYFDQNNNGTFDSLETVLPAQMVRALPDNWISASNPNGTYLINLTKNISNTWSCVNNTRYGTFTPASYSRTPSITGILSGTYNFGLRLSPGVNDLEAVLGATPSRPGFTTTVAFSVNNVGTTDQTGVTVKFYKPADFNIVSASLSPTSIINDTLIWENISIPLFHSASFTINLEVPVSAVPGSEVKYEAWANSIQRDSTPTDNYARWVQQITAAIDPNNKIVNKNSLPQNYNAAKDKLVYTIYFQNTGTAPAFTVIVRDTLPDNIDAGSLRVVNASHPYQLVVRDKNIIEVTFPIIQLPDSNSNEPASHGFVQLEFKAKASLPLNTEIINRAGILFDYNAPVMTNTATTTISITTGISSNPKLAFKLFPNPSSGRIQVELPYAGEGKFILFDMNGKMIMKNNIEATSTFQINVSDLPAATYLLSIEVNGVVSSSKVIILR
ncbi:MAG: hypothetical protein JWN78_634 [Bacteroidota bacterium]|nr:hypothetical protein [Bacteroidota bacterium]